jgi:hypothetical protein
MPSANAPGNDADADSQNVTAVSFHRRHVHDVAPTRDFPAVARLCVRTKYKTALLVIMGLRGGKGVRKGGIMRDKKGDGGRRGRDKGRKARRARE